MLVARQAVGFGEIGGGSRPRGRPPGCHHRRRRPRAVRLARAALQRLHDAGAALPGAGPWRRRHVPHGAHLRRDRRQLAHPVPGKPVPSSGSLWSPSSPPSPAAAPPFARGVGGVLQLLYLSLTPGIDSPLLFYGSCSAHYTSHFLPRIPFGPCACASLPGGGAGDPLSLRHKGPGAHVGRALILSARPTGE